ncbi:MAG: alanine racemase [Haloarculaceae archaeon]
MPTPTPTDITPALGTPVGEIETPALVVDLNVMDRNVEWYAEFAEANDVRLRSHAKTHKIPALARRQDERTGGGICCQTLSEAETMAAGGIDDIYLSYMVVTEPKLTRLVRLAEELSYFATTVDGRGNVDPLQAAAAAHGVTVDVIVEFDTGLGRVGVPSREGVVELAEYVDAQPNLSFQGLLAYEANVKGEAETAADYERLCEAAMEETAAVVADVEDAGLAVPEVKVGGTATSLYSGTHPIVTEINPGMYPFMDVGELERRPWEISIEDCAATVLSTVISSPADDRAVADAGSKSISMDADRAPLAKDAEGVVYDTYSEEHAWLNVDPDARGGPLAVGDRLSFVTPHVCTTFNLYDTAVGVRDGRVEHTWAIQARGKVK